MPKTSVNFRKSKPGYDAKVVAEIFDDLMTSYDEAKQANTDLEAQVAALQDELLEMQLQVSKRVAPNYSALGNAFEQVLTEAEKVDKTLRANAISKSTQDLQSARSLAEQTLLEARRTVANLEANSHADLETLRVDTERRLSELKSETETILRTSSAALEQAERGAARAITESEVEAAQFSQELHKELERVRTQLLELRAKHQYDNLQARYELKVQEEIQGRSRLEVSERASIAFKEASDAANAHIAAGVEKARELQLNAEQYLKSHRAESIELLNSTRALTTEALADAFALAETLIARAEELAAAISISADSVNPELVKKSQQVQELKNEVKSFATPEAIVSLEEANAHDIVVSEKQDA